MYKIFEEFVTNLCNTHSMLFVSCAELDDNIQLKLNWNNLFYFTSLVITQLLTLFGTMNRFEIEEFENVS